MLTDMGLCYTFNADSMERLYQDTAFFKTFKEHVSDIKSDKFGKDLRQKTPQMISDVGTTATMRFVFDSQGE